MVISFTSCFRNFLHLKQSGEMWLWAGCNRLWVECQLLQSLGCFLRFETKVCPEAEESLEHVFKNTLLQSSAWVCNACSFSVQHVCPWLLSEILFTALFHGVGKLSINSSFVLSWTKGSCLKFWLSEICFSWLIRVVRIVWFPKEPV